MLSGIQHFIFCRRQWALIHIEQQWAENERTIDGKNMHQNAHNPEYNTKRGEVITLRALKIHSAILGISGECDVVEFYKNDSGVSLYSFEGKWSPYPVEYKKGKPKENDADVFQLCAQAMCLEEMLCCNIEKGSIYYGETRRRMEVAFDEELRNKVRKTIEEMHSIYDKGYTPKVKRTKSCNACSLKDVCLPGLMKNTPVRQYLLKSLEEGEE